DDAGCNRQKQMPSFSIRMSGVILVIPRLNDQSLREIQDILEWTMTSLLLPIDVFGISDD
ncbi:MAG: hypothetical protein LH702_03605, partial [Phormidesmis sp. CAN_BIN44]|nr:hypothetical protein [Phormidesmis sp. CAN_BIN44]